MKKKLLIFASGTKDGGGSGFRKLCEAVRDGRLNAEIVGVVSHHENGGVAKIAKEFGIRFYYIPNSEFKKSELEIVEIYQNLVKETGAEFVALSGWLKLVLGLDPKTTFNIHPGLLPRFGGAGMYGHHVHEAVMDAYQTGEVKHSGFTMHFVTPRYDEGPIFAEVFVDIDSADTADTLGTKVNKKEHEYQWLFTNKVLNGEISWDGNNPDSLEGRVVITPAGDVAVGNIAQHQN